ncbi:acyl-phosphate glycerol 3-phosphate acyltransferase [Vulcanibacillus modesticaldus]|uniref:Glycerol-3-phosphate acyltransferase n=1 Tax=Vulcanibacillus modesticaldus TaxID=337097 RepID=A0A1D2YUM4_9BACI|nr:glycerol-3-phosphate 1-O-acyltransferase PlsY [Vulcanibacillus modesticaldus]OEF99414.1 acyl-phosphate glycerol 3-phosphate acyltransferase [Vulcanibacillus modesticaldus]
MEYIIVVLIGYLIGSIPTALIVSKRKNIDITKHGSGNIGATNSFRVLGKKSGILVTIIDILKGVIPTLFVLFWQGELMAVIVGIAAIIGHSFSMYVKFKGGKSVATSAGVMLVLSPQSIFVGVVVFAIVLFVTKYVSLSSMMAAISVAVSVWYIEHLLAIKIAVAFISAFIIARHHSNIKRLIQGKENKAFQKKDN